MNTYIQPQPPLPRREGLGCFGKGCLILCLLILFLLVAGAVGVYWGMRRHPEIVQGAWWASRSHVLSDKPADVPQFETTQENIAAAKQKWTSFDQATKRGEGARIELTAEEINDLIAQNRHARGKAYVTIEGNRLRIQTSIKMADFGSGRNFNGYYLNGDIVVEGSGASSLGQPNLSAITVNGHQLPANVLDWQYQNHSLRDYLGNYFPRRNLTSVDIRDGKVILNSEPAQ